MSCLMANRLSEFALDPVMYHEWQWSEHYFELWTDFLICY